MNAVVSVKTDTATDKDFVQQEQDNGGKGKENGSPAFKTNFVPGYKGEQGSKANAEHTGINWH